MRTGEVKKTEVHLAQINTGAGLGVVRDGLAFQFIIIMK